MHDICLRITASLAFRQIDRRNIGIRNKKVAFFLLIRNEYVAFSPFYAATSRPGNRSSAVELKPYSSFKPIWSTRRFCPKACAGA
jgi:hypothetical protein